MKKKIPLIEFQTCVHGRKVLIGPTGITVLTHA